MSFEIGEPEAGGGGAGESDEICVYCMCTSRRVQFEGDICDTSVEALSGTCELTCS